MHVPQLILASGSPRRRELLAAAGFRFVIDVPDVDETIADAEPAVAATARLAIEKAEAVVARRSGNGRGRAAGHPQHEMDAQDGMDARYAMDVEVVLAADTTVVLGDRILGKPASTIEAVEMLMSLAGRNHVVLTAWAVMRTHANGLAPECGVSRSIVRMREISRREAEAYAAGGEPMDKAGAYAAQGDGRRFIGAIQGPLDNVIGLPMVPVVRALAREGIVRS